MTRHHRIICIALACVVTFANFRNVEPNTELPEIPYPEGYRNWTHVKTYVVGPKSPAFKAIGGFNHVYANAIAMEGYRTGRFPNGSIIVSDVIEAKVDTMNTREGARNHIDVMMRDTVAFAATGGWSFETFSTDSKTNRTITPDVRKQCIACHAKQTDFVFSDFRK